MQSECYNKCRAPHPVAAFNTCNLRLRKCMRIHCMRVATVIRDRFDQFTWVAKCFRVAEHFYKERIKMGVAHFDKAQEKHCSCHNKEKKKWSW